MEYFNRTIRADQALLELYNSEFNFEYICKLVEESPKTILYSLEKNKFFVMDEKIELVRKKERIPGIRSFMDSCSIEGMWLGDDYHCWICHAESMDSYEVSMMIINLADGISFGQMANDLYLYSTEHETGDDADIIKYIRSLPPAIIIATNKVASDLQKTHGSYPTPAAYFNILANSRFTITK